ncbi:MAG TPA: hypothetical protein VM709_11380 [Candidatus Sulfotelmatobacter sp.]|nr:hypothetical protein [Candidatus Sulfotelmatobacter sp.]
MICHADFQALAILALAVAMIPTPCVTETLFIPAISFLALLVTGFFTAGVAAVAVPSVAVATDPEQLAAGAANPRT